MKNLLLEKHQGDLFIEKNDDLNTMSDSSKNNNPIIDYLDFEDGYEKALATVFSDELMASINKESTFFLESTKYKEISFSISR